MSGGWSVELSVSSSVVFDSFVVLPDVGAIGCGCAMRVRPHGGALLPDVGDIGGQVEVLLQSSGSPVGWE